jgi:hypothetical protein
VKVQKAERTTRPLWLPELSAIEPAPAGVDAEQLKHLAKDLKDLQVGQAETVSSLVGYIVNLHKRLKHVEDHLNTAGANGVPVQGFVAAEIDDSKAEGRKLLRKGFTMVCAVCGELVKADELPSAEMWEDIVDDEDEDNGQ